MIKVVEREDTGWSDWIPPIMAGYRMACCDCGLVHDMQFTVIRYRDDGNGWFTVLEEKVPDMKVLFRARRNKRSTAAARRHKKKAG